VNASASNALMSTARAQKALLSCVKNRLGADQMEGLELAQLVMDHARLYLRLKEFFGNNALVSDNDAKIADELARLETPET
jgi:hypothetical protein